MPVIDREEVFEVTIPAETPEAAPVVVATHFNPGTVVEVEVIVPAGAAGLAGVRISTNRAQVWPRTKGAWFIGDNEAIKREVYNWPNTGRLELEGYNTGKFAHAFQVRYGVVENAVPSAIISRTSAEPVPVVPGGGVEVGEPSGSPPPTPPSETPPDEGEPPTGEKPEEPPPETGGPPEPEPGEPPVESEGTAPPPPPVEGETPTPAPSLAPPEEGPEGEGSPPAAPSVPGAAPSTTAKRKKHRPTDAEIVAYRKAHHGHYGTQKQVEAWLASKHKRKSTASHGKGSTKRSPLARAKKSSTSRRTPSSKPTAKASAKRTPAAHHEAPKPAPKRTPPPRTSPHRAPHKAPPRRTPPPPPPPPPRRSAPPPPPPRHKRH